MKAITLSRFGDPDVMQIADVPEPDIRPTDLLIRVHAAGVNRADLSHRRGGYPHSHRQIQTEFAFPQQSNRKLTRGS